MTKNLEKVITKALTTPGHRDLSDAEILATVRRAERKVVKSGKPRALVLLITPEEPEELTDGEVLEFFGVKGSKRSKKAKSK
jgi:hypothetical protein